VAAGFIPVLASQDDGSGDGSAPDPAETERTNTERAKAAQRAAEEEKRLVDLLNDGADALREQVAERTRLNVTLDDTKTASEQHLELLSSELRILKNVLKEAQKRDDIDKAQVAI